MKNSLILTSLLIASLPGSHAAVINLDALSNTDWASPTTNAAFVNNTVVSLDSVVVGNRAGSPSAGDGSNTATLDVSTFILDDVAQPANLAYTVGGLDLDGSGGNNDSFVVTLVVSTDGQNIRTLDNGSEPRNAGWLSSGGTTLNADGEFIQFDFLSLSVNLNGGTGNGSGSFDGFTAARVGAFGAGDIARVNGTNVINGTDSALVDLTPEGLDSNLRFSFETAAGTAGTYRPDHFSIQLSVVPEPSSITLLGLSSFLLLRRRK